MAIYAKGATRNRPTELIIKAAMDSRIQDSDGNPFEIITLTSTVARAEGTSTIGFQDTFVVVEGNSLTIEHRGEGRLQWMNPEFGGMPKAQIAKTKRNMDMLAGHYFDGLWTIDDRMIDAEAKAEADKMRAGMSEEVLEFEKNRISALKTSKNGGKLVGRKGTTIDDQVIENTKNTLENDKKELIKQGLGLESKKAEIEKSITQAVKDGDHLTKYGENELKGIQLFKLRSIARKQLGLTIIDTEKKPEVIAKILAAQNGLEVKEESDIITV